VVIEEAPKDFSASRIDGRVRLEWNDSGNHWLNILYGDELVLELLYKPYLQVAGLTRRFIGYEKDLQGVIMLNDIPNSEVLELCIRVRKDDSLRKVKRVPKNEYKQNEIRRLDKRDHYKITFIILEMK